MAMLALLKDVNRTESGEPRWVDPKSGRPITPHGLRATFRTWGIVVDPEYLADRILSGNGVNRDTNYLENRQNAGDDATKDEWLTESGLELDFDTCNAVFKGASAFIP